MNVEMNFLKKDVLLLPVIDVQGGERDIHIDTSSAVGGFLEWQQDSGIYLS